MRLVILKMSLCSINPPARLICRRINSRILLGHSDNRKRIHLITHL